VASAVERRGWTGESEAAAVGPQLCCREESTVAPHPPATGNPAKKEMEPCTAHGDDRKGTMKGENPAKRMP
jgi:hypothetical protein